MENIHKIIIVCLVAVILALGVAIGFTLMKEPVKTVELFKNGTTVEVPESTVLINKSEIGNEYQTGKNTTIIGIDNNNFAGALASKILSDAIVEVGEKQDNGLYKLDKKSIMEMGDGLGFEYDEININEAYIGIKHNNTVNQTVFLIGIDQQEMVNIIDSIHWKAGVRSNNTVTEPSTPQPDEKTYPFYADDGSIVGYYHVGDVVTHYDGLYQLKSNGEWVYIGEAAGASQEAYSQGYSDAIDDSYDDSSYYEDESYDDYYYDYGDYDPGYY